jgi:glucose-6-phosphate isomerase
MTLRYDDTPARAFLREHEIGYSQRAIEYGHDLLHRRHGAGAAYTGWLDWPSQTHRHDLPRIVQVAKRIQGMCDTLVVIGIGGSYLGTRATIESLTSPFRDMPVRTGQKTPFPTIWYAGHQLSETYLKQLLVALEHRDFALHVISKSGTTTEPAIAFRVLKQALERRYGKAEAQKRIIVTTDASQGALRQQATVAGYDSFVVPDDVGGRYSVLTAVGLLPLAVAGIDIEAMIAGAQEAERQYADVRLDHNACYRYAAVRNAFSRKGKTVELLAYYEPQLHMFGEWWKQLFGESEGKDQKGIFPATVQFTTDLHSMGQYIQDGMRHMFETVIDLVPSKQAEPLTIPQDAQAHDGLDDLVGQPIDAINQQAMYGTLLAHTDGGVPNTLIHIEQWNAYSLGHLFYFFQKACAISGYMLGVNPFDQPGVEQYKQNMYALLGKPGYETLRAALQARLEGTLHE